ncbi:MAG: carboxylesterase family protein [Planctomycetota bacterium]|jgi:predicted peptidase
MKILPYILLLTTLSALGQSDRRNTRNKGAGVPEKVIEAYESASFHGMPYRLLLPEDYDSSIRYPLILSLHGGSGIGDDNLSQLRRWTSIFVGPDWREKYPCVVVVPQSWDSWLAFNERAPDPESSDQTWESPVWEKFLSARGYPSDLYSTGSLTLAFLLVDDISRRYSVDEDRVYVLGHSGGGFGSWNAIWHDPGRFAAAIPSAGGLLPWKDPARFKDVPVWTFHGDADPVVPVEFTREIFERIKKVGGIVKFTELGGVKHGAERFAFKYKGDDPDKKFITHSSSNRCDQTEDIWEWLFSQRR